MRERRNGWPDANDRTETRPAFRLNPKRNPKKTWLSNDKVILPIGLDSEPRTAGGWAVFETQAIVVAPKTLPIKWYSRRTC